MLYDERMTYLVNLLNDACKSYYTGDNESTLTDSQYDKHLKELLELEAKAGYRLAESPTIRVGYQEDGDKIKHYSPILSLKDTKDIDELLYFLGDKEGVLSWKLDGVSIVLYYQNGILERAVSRGDGIMGKDITRNVMLINCIPKTIDLKNTVIVRGEGCISVADFDTIKQTPDGEKYRNPRNLASGLINSQGTRDSLLKYVTFIVHSLVFINGFGRKLDAKTELFSYLSDLGFNVVPHITVANYTLRNEIDKFTSDVPEFPYPVDGLVLTLNDLAYAQSLGSTARFPRDSMAFKWEDTTAVTKVRGVKWSVSQTGLITPVLVMDPVELEGTTVRQASLHNLRMFEELDIGMDDKVEVFKANKIIPEIKDNLTRSGTETYPKICPVCGKPTVVMSGTKTRKLYCINCGRDKLPEDVKEAYLSKI